MTNEERQLIIDSIEHWTVDGIDMFQKGFTLKIDNIRWNRGSVHIRCKLDVMGCPLCQHYLFQKDNVGCDNCLWYRYTTFECCDEDQEYDIFINNPTKEKAQNVIEKLWRIGTNA